jgi:hypothetical protein
MLSVLPGDGEQLGEGFLLHRLFTLPERMSSKQPSQ